eukprot:1453409-Rhodomonas_salina.2
MSGHRGAAASGGADAHDEGPSALRKVEADERRLDSVWDVGGAQAKQAPLRGEGSLAPVSRCQRCVARLSENVPPKNSASASSPTSISSPISPPPPELSCAFHPPNTNSSPPNTAATCSVLAAGFVPVVLSNRHVSPRNSCTVSNKTPSPNPPWRSRTLSAVFTNTWPALGAGDSGVLSTVRHIAAVCHAHSA